MVLVVLSYRLCCQHTSPRAKSSRLDVTLYFAPWTVPSCPAYEPNSEDWRYSQPFRHIQYNRIASLCPMAVNSWISACPDNNQSSVDTKVSPILSSNCSASLFLA
jgi:hypothetical protein